ncbi:MAG TPA: [2,4-di-O-methyl-alpha-L-fucopyranosyl-(1-_3)-alpha-L-rhamnopyranosyl-(1-_3)-2-O-methyl-alpha-L-rhamnopyranosyl] dimycocerosyl phenol-phthiocerol 3'''-O-methyltransferase [Mycobacterium sp.]|uniref:[2, 4-di-O-methyl-alpha-L-fucopyranosyl-(1->3)-alpha-L- rhamnopyranosyl-(1->3)-2-O-methyl-alpha-L-rhamnopyranosyl] dimycocerosyl phenol-phthiocerol 3'''-O-methyltransferase n=1 Tax=Mycobacterium sp. TaxID=1785 RepID=UPI002D2881CF|nr:[2,4-di-O-methyl-alpha-L-fucopyranosyl-(1->3)-alpha-L-rhamnopyranosyl-(1->3)-2-O-methyl-alpha-L-rhamnopyranosyl] dimycocerosyl phenol-phthiocerol 3'''-O-methyltransferase [Mycobacterium sp.]HXY66873.1 [2,4-di-O-methyl-alpha-L-fucopyranosyl-(1->3)-alpha-L-rhamnopyranosyl-(1->3)-2-O-methyl-alpha-L-rhamnopyranosyl] dimycocerosyl phenol-phthiocerol 3'''-O-methyltransferase [Mycobacterium sp.]
MARENGPNGKRLGVDVTGRTAEQRFRTKSYVRHNARRQEHLATLGLDLSNKSVLEVGAGIGDHTTFFLDRGCKVLCTEGREENLNVIRRRFESAPNVAVEQLNLDGALPAATPRYDVVYCYGLLYHLSRPAEALAWMCDRAAGLLLLETCVSFSSEDKPFPVSEIASSQTQAITGTGCRPSRVWVMNRLREKMPHVYVTATQPRHKEFPLDWTAPRPTSSTGLARAVFVASRAPLNLPTLVRELPMVQRRC